MNANKQNNITLSALGALFGVITSAVGGSLYVSNAITSEGKRAHIEAVRLVEQQKAQVAEVYARREDLRVLEVKLDTVMEMQERLYLYIKTHREDKDRP